MRKVTLAKSIRFPGGPLHKAGSTVEIEDSLYDKFVAKGVFVVEVVEPVETTPVTESEVAEGEPVTESEVADSEPVTESEVAEGEPVRPAKSADIEAWREFARSQGFDPKGKTKKELVAQFG